MTRLGGCGVADEAGTCSQLLPVVMFHLLALHLPQQFPSFNLIPSWSDASLRTQDAVDMAATLQTCPDDIVEAIVQLLSLEDVRNLRLSCTTLARKASHNSFRNYFRSQHVEMTVESLQSFIDGYQLNGPRSLIKHLYLVGVIDEAPDGDQWAELVKKGPELRRLQQEALLRQIFQELAQRPDNELQLTLTFASRPGLRGEDPVPSTDMIMKELHFNNCALECARTTFSIVMRSLAISKLKPTGINLFNDPKIVHTANALTPEHFNTIDWSSPATIESLAAIKSLSICFQSLMIPARASRVGVRTEIKLKGLLGMIRACPLVEDLSLQHLHVSTDPAIRELLELTGVLMKSVTELDPPLALQRCSLHQFVLSQEQLLAFLKCTKPRELSLSRVILHSDSNRDISPIFDYFTSAEAGLTKLSLQHWSAMRDKTGFGQEPENIRSDPFARGVELEGDDLKHPIDWFIDSFPHTARVRNYLIARPLMARGYRLTQALRAHPAGLEIIRRNAEPDL